MRVKTGARLANSSQSRLDLLDGPDDAAAAIVTAGEMLVPGIGVVLTVSEPVALWAPSDPATILGAPLSRLASKEFDLDEISQGAASEPM